MEDFLLPVATTSGTATATYSIDPTSLNRITISDANNGNANITMISETNNVVDFATEDFCLCIDMEVVEFNKVGGAVPIWNFIAPGGNATFAPIVPGPAMFNMCVRRTGPTTGLATLILNNGVPVVIPVLAYPSTPSQMEVLQPAGENILSANLFNIGGFAIGFVFTGPTGLMTVETNLNDICLQTSASVLG